MTEKEFLEWMRTHPKTIFAMYTGLALTGGYILGVVVGEHMALKTLKKAMLRAARMGV